MMLKYLIYLILISTACLTGANAATINLDPLINVLNFKYPEEKNKAIKIKKDISRLDSASDNRSQIEDLFNQYNIDPGGNILEQVTKFGFNKFSMGTGLVDVTFQVKNGVEYALKDTLGGYPEYQRRKTTEEMLNANFRSHRLTNNFLIGSSNKHSTSSVVDFIVDIFNVFTGDSSNGITTGNQVPSLIQTIKVINHKPAIQEIYHFFQSVAYTLLGLITMLIVFQRLSHNELHWEYSISNPLINSLGAGLVIALIGEILDLLINIVSSINSVIISTIFDIFSSPYSLDYTELAYSWQTLVNQIGYMPGLILSIIDTLAQFFVYFFIAGLILSIVIGKVLSPLWGLALVSESLKSNSINSFVQWCKSLLVIVLIPVSYLVIKFIIQEFANLNLYFLEVSLSIASFLYLPALFNIILARGNGIFQPVFSGYQSIVDNINSSYQGLKTALENNNRVS